MGAGSVDAIHVTIEAMKRAYADRARYLGDPAFVNAPTFQLTGKDYAARQRATIDLSKATPWSEATATSPREGSNTTHYSVVDSSGNAVSNTYTLNFSYGLGLVAEGTGVLLNNELDDFTAATSNASVSASGANLLGPGKRPLSSCRRQSCGDGKPVLVTIRPAEAVISAVTGPPQCHRLRHEYRRGGFGAAAHQWLPDEFAWSGFSKQRLLRAAQRSSSRSVNLGQFGAITPDGLLGTDPHARATAS